MNMTTNKIVRYSFSHALNALFELPTEIAGQYLPKGIEPIEPFHGTSLLGITLFEFNESPVGPYQEVVLSIFVSPKIRFGEKHPHGAVAPLLIASTREETRQHAIELWHLPHYLKDIRIDFKEKEGGLISSGTVYCSQAKPILELTLHRGGPWNLTSQHYQSFQRDASGSYLCHIDWDCSLDEHENRTGSVRLFHDHEFFTGIELSEMEVIPYREMLMKDGVESYHPILHH